MTTVYLDDRWTIRVCGDTLEHILLADGVHYALSYLKRCVLVPPYSESPRFLSAISKLKSVRELLSRLPPEEAQAIRRILRKGDKR